VNHGRGNKGIGRGCVNRGDGEDISIRIEGMGMGCGHGAWAWVLPSPRPWDFPPSIDGDVSREDDPMELDDLEEWHDPGEW
jgi:hypothetical protein